MNELEQRVKILEEKVNVLEETLETLKNMQLSEQMEGYIKAKTKAVHMIDLLNAVSDEPLTDFDSERSSLENMRAEKASVDSQIAEALAKSSSFSEDYPSDTRYFNYEIESGVKSGDIASVLAPFAGKGIRITYYTGFEQVIVVPEKIDGYPVVSIGEFAFQGATASQIILPSSLKVIMNQAFNSCKNLENVVINGVEIIDHGAFYNCTKLKRLALPNGIKEIHSCAFAHTDIKTIIFPESLKKLLYDVFVIEDLITYDYDPIPEITCVFRGMDTVIDNYDKNYNDLYGADLIYCLPGSKVQRYAREHSIPVKPLSEFKMEDYT